MVSNDKKFLFIMTWIKSRLDDHAGGDLTEFPKMVHMAFDELGLGRPSPELFREFVEINNEFIAVADILKRELKCNPSKFLQ